MAKKEYGTRKKYHFIYKTTNLLSGKYYIGMHSTDDLNDGYLGSGTLLRRSLNKYGKENHSIEILEFLNSREELVAREKDIVSLQEIAKKECMNLKVGGSGGFTLEQAKRGRQAADKVLEERYGKDFRKIIRESYMNSLTDEKREKISQKVKEGLQRVRFNHATRTGVRLSEETKQKIGKANSIKQKGEKNSQYGTCWITNGSENKKIKKGQTPPEGWSLGRIRKP